MGCEVQVHKKTDKGGTWSYHSLDGWYLSTSPEHYRIHNCHIKSTSAERLTDAIQFQHKNITNPTISPQDKIMLALANCKTALTGMMSGGPYQQMEELQTIVTNAHTHLQQHQESILQQVPRVETHQVPRVDTPIPQQPATRATATPTAGRSTRTPPTRRRSCRNSLSHLTADINLPAAPPALSTRSKARGAVEHQRVSRLCQPTQVSRGKTRQAKAVTEKPNWRLRYHREVDKLLV